MLSLLAMVIGGRGSLCDFTSYRYL
ncbi:MAG: hypothetical protein RLZZ320_996, partial [Actinomycetota bacterium]